MNAAQIATLRAEFAGYTPPAPYYDLWDGLPVVVVLHLIAESSHAIQANLDEHSEAQGNLIDIGCGLTQDRLDHLVGLE